MQIKNSDEESLKKIDKNKYFVKFVLLQIKKCLTNIFKQFNYLIEKIDKNKKSYLNYL